MSTENSIFSNSVPPMNHTFAEGNLTHAGFPHIKRVKQQNTRNVLTYGNKTHTFEADSKPTTAAFYHSHVYSPKIADNYSIVLNSQKQ